MAFLATNQLPADAYEKAKRQAVQLKNLAVSRSTEFASGAAANVILATADNITAMRDNLNTYKAVPGIAAYAADQEDDPLYDVAAEFTAMIAAADAVIANIGTTMPTDGTYSLIVTVETDATLTWRTFTGVQLATLRGLLDTLAVSIS